MMRIVQINRNQQRCTSPKSPRRRSIDFCRIKDLGVRCPKMSPFTRGGQGCVAGGAMEAAIVPGYIAHMSAPYRAAQRYTLQEYENLQEADGYASELSHGLLVREPRPGVRHSQVVGNVFAELRAHVLADQLGSVLVECGFRLALEPPTVRGPDVAFVSKARLPAEVPIGFYPFAPDLAVEVASAANSLSEMQQKVIEYFEAGARLVWVIDPQSRTALVYKSLSDIALLREDDILTGGDVVPGFALQLGLLF